VHTNRLNPDSRMQNGNGSTPAENLKHTRPSMAALPDNCLDRSIILPPPAGSPHYEKAPRSWQDVAASAAQWGEPVSGRELHPAEVQSFFRGTVSTVTEGEPMEGI
jgi:hypothetical protein